MSNFFKDYFDSNNTSYNHRQFATFTAAISLGLAIGLYIKDFPNGALVAIAVGLFLSAIKFWQANLAFAKLLDGDQENVSRISLFRTN